jgi:hypothetical protein
MPLFVGLLMFAAPALIAAQEIASPATNANVMRVEIRPASLTLDVNDSARVTATAIDARGNRLPTQVLLFSSSRRAVAVTQDGAVRANRPGEYRLLATVAGRDTILGEAVVNVRWPAVKSVEITSLPQRLYAGTTVRPGARVVDVTGAKRNNVNVVWTSSDANVVRVSRLGELTFVKPGNATLRASGGGITATRPITVVADPARRIELSASEDAGRTGDVIRFTAVVRDGNGREVPHYPISYSVSAQVEDTVIAPSAPAQIDQLGRFVAERAGTYTIFATGGSLSARHSVPITHRYTSMRLATPKGHGAVRDVHTSDLWVWEGKDGRDYAVTGTWGANGVAYFWDVTDPAAIVLTDSVQVDARTVNDVKVDVERELCVITREGASSRRNGFVVLDCSNPRNVRVISRFDDGLVGGVHNVFIWNKHVFAINAGRRFDIISIEDPRNPRRVGFFDLGRDSGIHDVWVVDGIAYTSNWSEGIAMIDVGKGVAGGSLANPVLIGEYKYPIGATHSAFPYHSKSAGDRFYVFVGDEQFPYGLEPDDATQAEAGGYIHIVDFTDPKNPEEVARYQVPEAGPHNFWIENDTLYVAYYNAGLRVVDISGELKGNLYDQGRELVRWRPMDPLGKVANTPMAWGPQPHKGHVFVSDFNAGLFSIRLPEREEELTP